MNSLKKTIRAIGFISAFIITPATTRAVDPPPDGGYPNANTAEGDQALYSLTTGADNTAVGFNALFSNTTGNSNTTVGFYSLANNTTGSFNTGYGQFALQSNGTGTNNTGIGYNTLFNNTIGKSNVALGASAGINLTTGSNNVDIANGGVAGESNTIRIGTPGTQTATFIAGIKGTAITGVVVGISADGQLGVRASSARFKESIKPMDKTSEAILALRPVIFHYKKEVDPNEAPQFGLIAEEVAKVNPDLVVPDEKGKPFSVRYEEVNAMLLNEFLKEHRKVEEQARVNREQEAAMADVKSIVAKQTTTITDLNSVVAQQQKEIQTLAEALKAQGAQIQKVNAQLRAQAAPRIAINN